METSCSLPNYKFIIMKNVFLIVVCLLAGNYSFSQNTPTPAKVHIIKCTSFSVSKPLSDLFETDASEKDNRKMKESEDKDERKLPTYTFTEKDGQQYGEDMSIRQTAAGNRQSTSTIANWAGQVGNFYPTDATGAAGPNHYVQCVNSTPVKVFNKTNGALLGTVHHLGSLWSPAVGNGGDPIVLYDKYADRWFLSQIGIASNGDLNTYIAISTTPDPTGTYYTYTFATGQYPDYQKFSIWADGYYMTANQNTDEVYCFERDSMLAGSAAARSIGIAFTTGTTSSFYVPLPADADGQLPPYGTPLPFFAFHDNAWTAGGDEIRIWSMSVNWISGIPTATISATPDSVALTAFNSAYSSTLNDIPQPGTTLKLDGLGGYLNFRAQWRKWTGYNSVVLNFAVRISATQRGIRWVELRQDDSTLAWTKFQEGTYAPGTSSYWCASIAMNDCGSIALCYNKSSSAAGDYPSLAYTGRIANDPLGTMTIGETVAFQGTGALTQTNRWGDYSHTCLDPDGITFWHTGEYATNVNPNVGTRIYSFQLPCFVGIAENENSEAVINVFQSNSEIEIIGTHLQNDDELKVDLFDISGKQLAAKKVKSSFHSFQTSFDVSALAKATYLVRVGKENSSFQRVKKIIVK